MKLSLLAIAVGSIILVGCNDSSTDTISFSKDVRAFDGAIQGMTGKFVCDNSSGTIDATDYDGFSTIEDKVFAISPETCSLTFNKTKGAVDTSNGKDMSEVSYRVPRRLLQAGKEVAGTATPLTTIIAEELGDDDYTEQVAKDTLKKLGIDIDHLINTDGVPIDLLELLTDQERALNKLKGTVHSDVYSQIMVTTVVLSDTLVAQGGKGVTVDQLANVARRVSQAVLSEHPNYPENDNGDEIYVDLSEALEDEAVFNKFADLDTELDPNDPDLAQITDDITTGKPAVAPERPLPPTGGTGGTGGSGSEGGGGA